MDQDKVKAVASWSTPVAIKVVQRLIGFTNVYRWFIWGFSTIVAPLTALLKKTRKLVWTAVTKKAFTELENAFTTAPILHYPDPSKPFVVEVDALESGVGAVPSQRFGEKAKMFPVAFFSRNLTPAEWNYDIGDRE